MRHVAHVKLKCYYTNKIKKAFRGQERNQSSNTNNQMKQYLFSTTMSMITYC